MLLTLLACTPSFPTSETDGFTMSTNAFPFPNFATGYGASMMDTALMQRMFGDGVCVGGLMPCTLTPAAQAFANTANVEMTSGRCEGFAVLSTLMFTGDVNPVNFGAESASTLMLDGNVPLQQEIAYWFTTQFVTQLVTDKTQSFSANNVLPFLATALKGSAKERYRLGIMQRVGHGRLTGGHALVPIDYYEGTTKGVYYLEVYDNNTPDVEGYITIDTNANSWTYMASVNPGEAPEVYEGDSTNDNVMYFAPVRDRLGVLPCRFCANQPGVQVTTTGGAEGTAQSGNGSASGVTSGTTSGDATPVMTSDFGPPDYIFTTSEPGDVKLTITPLGDPMSTSTAGISALGAGYVVGLQGLTNTTSMTHQIAITNSGASVAFTNPSRSSVTLSTSFNTSSGQTVQVSTTIVGGSDSVSVDTDPSSGAVTVATEGSSGAGVTVTVTQTNNTTGATATGSVSFTSSGSSTLNVPGTMINPDGGVLTGTLENGDGGTMTVSTNTCGDGVQDGNETGVDCGGGTCPACPTGQGCKLPSDCLSNACDEMTHLCVASTCQDGVQDGNETGVDCGGGTCPACPAGDGCKLDSDCLSGVCMMDLCVATYTVSAAVSGLPGGATVTLQDNGGDNIFVQQNGTYAFPTPVTGAYDVTVFQQPAIASCTVTSGSGTATANVTVNVTCTALYSIGGQVTGLPSGTQVTLQDNGGDNLVLQEDGLFAFPTLVSGMYDVTILTQPSVGMCAVTNAAGTAIADVTDVMVTCMVGCPVGYAGPTCTACADGYQDNDDNGTCLPDCATAALTCNGEGTCDDSSGTAVCDCTTGYTGASCTTCASGYQDNDHNGTCLPSCATANLTCVNGGMCSDASGMAMCACPLGYGGADCSVCATGYQDNGETGMCNPDCATAGLTCSGEGTCDDSTGLAMCDCSTGYTGPDCSSCDTGYSNYLGNTACVTGFSEQLGASTSNEIALATVGDSSGDAYVVGTFDGTTNIFGGSTAAVGSPDGFLLAFNPQGNFSWGVHLSSSSSLEELTVAIDGSGNLFVAGISTAPSVTLDSNGHSVGGSGTYAFLVSYTSAGVYRWSQTFTAVTVGGLAVDPSSGNVVIAGYVASSTNFGQGDVNGSIWGNAYLASYTNSGAVNWGNVYSGTSGASYPSFDAVAVDASGTIYVSGDTTGTTNVGTTLTNNGATTPLVASYTSTGAYRWARTFTNGSINGTSGSIAVDSLGNVLIAASVTGSLNFGGGPVEVLETNLSTPSLVQFSAATGAWVAERDFIESADMSITALVIDGSNNVHIVGKQGGGDLGAGTVPVGNYYASYTDGLIYRTGQVAGGGGSTVVGVSPLPSGGVILAGSVDSSTALDWGYGSLTSTGDDLWLGVRPPDPCEEGEQLSDPATLTCAGICPVSNPFNCGVSPDYPATSCATLKNAQPTLPDGFYWINAGGETSFYVACDMTTNGGGWTVVASFSGGTGESGVTSDGANLTGNPLSFQRYNLTQAQKIAVSLASSSSLFVRGGTSPAWLSTSAALFDATLATPNTEVETPVTMTSSDGTMVSGTQGWSNYNISAGGDFGLTTTSFDHSNANAWMLNASCGSEPLFSTGLNTGYGVEEAVGAWTPVIACGASPGVPLYFAVK